MRVDYDPKQSVPAGNSRDLLRHVHAVLFRALPSPARGHIKRWGEGFRCDYVTT
jgi:hypothetical protein